MVTSKIPAAPKSSTPTTVTAVSAAKQGSNLISNVVFDCYSPPPENSLKGALVPRFLTKRTRRRKISIEVHAVTNPGAPKGQVPSTYEECIVRVMDHLSKREASRLHQHEHDEDNNDDDDSTVVPPELNDSASAGYALPTGTTGRDWVAKYRFPIRALTIKSTHRNDVTVEIQLGKVKQVRDLVFDSLQDSVAFQEEVQKQKDLEDTRTASKLAMALGHKGAHGADEKITFLVEIVSAWDLPAGDFTSSDPYVVCSMNGKEVHRTKYISKTLDPIWTLETGSLFLLTVTSRELFSSDGLLCTLKDYDNVGKNETLGQIVVPPPKIYDGKGERQEFKLQPPSGMRGKVTGYLAIRCRRATDFDVNFMAEASRVDKKVDPFGIKKAMVEATSGQGGASNLKSLLTKRHRLGKESGKKEYKIRPGPDPERPEETTWMTKEALEAECRKESKHWVDAGSGSLGRLYVEILGCDDLPNMDTGGFAGNKTDAFVSLVFEDCVARTDVIDDTLSPRWLPWMKRAFILNIFHSSSQLFLGVFDFDVSLNPTDDHDLIGRVSVDISNLRKDTVYILSYNIYTTAQRFKREIKGSITIRLRLEIDDERKLLLSAIEPPPKMYVNVKKRKDFRVVRYTCTGKYDMDKYSMTVINSYIEELLALQHVVFYLQDAALALILWKGTLPLTVFGRSISLPVHSATAFLTAILLVERPQLIPSFTFGGLAWILLASTDYRQRLPDPWSRCKSFAEFCAVLILGESLQPPQEIREYENQEEAEKFLEAWKKRIMDADEHAAKAYEESVKAQEEYEKEMEEIGEVDTDLAKSKDGYNIDPFKPILFPVQQSLQMTCGYVRLVKYILAWEECYISFWLTLGSIALAFIFFFIPWFFLLKWGSRFLVWGVFGPHMWFIDRFYLSKLKAPTEAELTERKRQEQEKRRLTTAAAVSAARIKREDAAKLKSMKKHMFGKFITRVPILKEGHYRDLPLSSSSAVPYAPERRPLSEIAMQDAGYHRTRLPGQHLVGDMIPKMESTVLSAPVGKPTSRPGLVDRSGPGGAGVVSGRDSTLVATVFVGSIFVMAGVATWVVVPLISLATERFLGMVSWRS